MKQATQIRKEIKFYEQVMECTDRKLVKDAARGKKEELSNKLNELLNPKPKEL